MSTVSNGKPSLEEYKPIVGEHKIEEIRLLAAKLSGRRICHLNSTAYGGGVAEILNRLVPITRAVGLEIEWKVMKGSTEFFNVTKIIHNGMQGMNVSLTEEMKKTYLHVNEINSEELNLDYDFVVIHDPQPAPIISYRRSRPGKWIWRCHIDLSNPSRKVSDFIFPFILQYDALIFTMKQYVQELLREKNHFIIAPSIDPLSAKNNPLSESTVLSILDKFDVDISKPIIAQVGRFDPWKDPMGTIDLYRIIKKEIPGLQLLLIASMAEDDPEGWTYYEKTARHAGNDYDIHLLTDLIGVRDTEVNAFQRASNAVLQMSTREGFGLTVAEALWKEVPVVGRNVGGIPLQIIDGQTGYLVSSIAEAVEKTVHLLKHPDLAKEMGKRGKAHVQANFLITRHLEDYLRLFGRL